MKRKEHRETLNTEVKTLPKPKLVTILRKTILN